MHLRRDRDLTSDFTSFRGSSFGFRGSGVRLRTTRRSVKVPSPVVKSTGISNVPRNGAGSARQTDFATCPAPKSTRQLPTRQLATIKWFRNSKLSIENSLSDAPSAGSKGGGTAKRFRGGLVFETHILVYHSNLGWRVIKNKRRRMAAHRVLERRAGRRRSGLPRLSEAAPRSRCGWRCCRPRRGCRTGR